MCIVLYAYRQATYVDQNYLPYKGKLREKTTLRQLYT